MRQRSWTLLPVAVTGQVRQETRQKHLPARHGASFARTCMARTSLHMSVAVLSAQRSDRNDEVLSGKMRMSPEWPSQLKRNRLRLFARFLGHGGSSWPSKTAPAKNVHCCCRRNLLRTGRERIKCTRTGNLKHPDVSCFGTTCRQLGND